MLDLDHWQEILKAEQTDLEGQLGKVGHVNPQNKNDWEVKPLAETETSFRDEVADELEEMEEREEVEHTLEQRLRNVRLALEKFDKGNYGICEVGGEEIEPERLEANPAARTCKAHLAEEKFLR